ncbi:MAG: HEAT repeat domain-containing protein [Thermoanaerobaculia bacterium]
MKRLISLLPILFCVTASRAAAADLGGCGGPRGIQSIIASSSTGAAVGSGMEPGIVVYLHGLSKADQHLIEIPYGAGLLAEPGGNRFALREGRTIHLYGFAGFKRISKSSAKVLKDQSVKAWTWIDGTDEVAIFSSIEKSGMFDMGESKKMPYLLRVNVATGAGTQTSLPIPNDFLSAAFDARGERVAIGFGDGHVEVRSAADGQLQASYKGHDAAWNSLGLAFHPGENLLASSDGGKLVLFDLETRQIRSIHQTQDGDRFLAYVADGQFLIGGGVSNLSLLDPQGKRLETSRSEDGYEDFYVADALRKVFSVRGGLACWRTFERWEKVPVVARGAGSPGGPPAPADVVYKGVPLSFQIEQLRASSAKARLDALYAIEQMGPPAAAAVPDLVKALSSPEWTERAGAARALGAIGPAAKAALPGLEALRRDGEESVRAAASAAIQKIGAREEAGKGASATSGTAPAAAPGDVLYKGKPLSQYIRQLNDPDFTARLDAYFAIEQMGPAAEAAVPALIDVLDGREPARKAGEPSLKGTAIRVLGAIGPAAGPAAGRIGEALRSDNADLRRAAAAALVKLGPAGKAAVPALIADLGDPIADIREKVIQALGAIGPEARAAIPALKAIEKDKREEQYIRNSADDALEKIEKK